MSIINAEQDDFDMEFSTLIQSLNIQNPMSFDEYINVPEEEESHELLTDEQLIEAAQTIEEDKEQEMAIEKSSLTFTFSKKESIIGLGKAIAILEAHDVMQEKWDSKTEELIRGLRKKQTEIRRELMIERDQNISQVSIIRFFSS